MMGKEKKVLLFVVEGPTEEAALASIMESVFSSNRIFFDVVHGQAARSGAPWLCLHIGDTMCGFYSPGCKAVRRF